MPKTMHKRINLDTGEVTRYIDEEEAVKVGGLFMKALQNGMGILASLKLRGVTHQVLDCIVAKAGYQNTIPSKKKVSTKLQMQYSGVDRAYRELINKGVLIKLDGENFTINPRIYWKGNMQQWEQAMFKLNELEIKGTIKAIKEKNGTD